MARSRLCILLLVVVLVASFFVFDRERFFTVGTLHIYPTFAEANKYAAGACNRAHAATRLLRLALRYHTWQLG